MLPFSKLRTIPLVAAVGLAGLAAAPTGGATAQAATVATTAVTCVKGPDVQPPPRAVLPKPIKGDTPGLAPARPAKPVCPTGAVPVVQAQSKTLAKGVPGLAGRALPRAAAGTSPPPPPPAPPKCAGVIYPFDPNTCFYYAGASESRDARRAAG